MCRTFVKFYHIDFSAREKEIRREGGEKERKEKSKCEERYLKSADLLFFHVLSGVFVSFLGFTDYMTGTR